MCLGGGGRGVGGGRLIPILPGHNPRPYFCRDLIFNCTTAVRASDSMTISS